MLARLTYLVAAVSAVVMLGLWSIFLVQTTQEQALSTTNQATEKDAFTLNAASVVTGTEILGSDDITATFVYLPIILRTTPSYNPKKGVGITRPPGCDDLEKLKASWYFKWSPFPDSTCDEADLAKFIPRIADADDMVHLDAAIENAKASGWLMGFTEPNLPNQANLTPREGAQLWRQIEQNAIPAGIKLISPAPSQHDPAWLRDMILEYQDLYGSANKPTFDAVAFNVFYSNPDDIKTYLQNRRNDAVGLGYGDVPIWVLEYGGKCWTSNPGNDAVMDEVTPWMESKSWIGRYAWYANRLTTENLGWQRCSLIDVNTGQPTSLGSKYSLY